jgi:hypothetical protein
LTRGFKRSSPTKYKYPPVGQNVAYAGKSMGRSGSQLPQPATFDFCGGYDEYILLNGVYIPYIYIFIYLFIYNGDI